MLRLAALLLLLVNLLLLALHAGLLPGWLGRPAGAGQREPERLARQVNPGALQMLVPVAASAASLPASAAPAAAAAPASAVAALPSPAASSLPALSAEASAAACLQAGPFDSASTAVAERSLQEAGVPAGAWVRRGAAPAKAYLVYMGRYADADALARKRDELRQLAVPAYPVDAASGLQPGLSLGRHASAEAAEAALAALAQRGVRTARVVAVAGAGSAGTVLRLSTADAALQASLAGLRLPSGSGFRPCADQPLAGANPASAVAPAASR